jgi:hypothetical protein
MDDSMRRKYQIQFSLSPEGMRRISMEGQMEVLTILQNVIAFSPEDITVLVSAFESALDQIGLVNREDPLTLMVAKQIIAAAKEGVRDPQNLTATALAAFGLGPKE